MKYCIKTTTSHPISISNNCIVDINTLIVKEGFSEKSLPFTNNEICINLDEAEKIVASVAKRAQNKSMDMAVGLANSDSSIREILLVELRLNYDNPNNLNRTELEGKVAGSTLILSNVPPIHNLFVFIFKTNQIQEARNRLSRMIPQINSNYVVMDVHTLKANYF